MGCVGVYTSQLCLVLPGLIKACKPVKQGQGTAPRSIEKININNKRYHRNHSFLLF